MIRLLRAHGDLLIGAAALCAGVFMACVLGPTLDKDSRGFVAGTYLKGDSND